MKNKEKSNLKKKWTLIDEYIFFEAHSIIGNKWVSIHEYLPDK